VEGFTSVYTEDLRLEDISKTLKGPKEDFRVCKDLFMGPVEFGDTEPDVKFT